MIPLRRDSGRNKELNEEKRVGPYVIQDKIIGEGTTATVKLAFNTITGKYAAVKVVDKSVERKRNEARKEINILQTVKGLDCALIHLEHVEEDPHFIYIFLTYCELGDLYSYIERVGTFEEREAKKLFRHLVNAVSVCHRKLRICHHDIKLENCVIDANFNLKLIDFGFAVPIGAAGKPHIEIFDSSPAYSPLEILHRRPHDESVDIFSMGICLYFMVCGSFPFCDAYKTSLEELAENLQFAELEFHSVRLSSALQNLLSRMLAKKKRRISLDEIKNHPWLTSEERTIL